MTHAVMAAHIDARDVVFSEASFKSRVSVCRGWVVGGRGVVLAQARHRCQHKLDASSFVKECLSEPQSGRVSMKQFIVQLAAGCPPTEGSPFAFSGNDNSCFGWRELEGLPLPLLGPRMGVMSRILIYILKCQEVVPDLCGSNCLVIPNCSSKLDTPPPSQPQHSSKPERLSSAA